MIAMFRISLRNRFGIERSASATSFSNASRCTRSRLRLSPLSFQFSVLSFEFRRRRALARDDQPIVVAVVDDEALIAERLRPADAAAVEDQGVGRPRPA